MLSPKPLFSVSHFGERVTNESDVLKNQAKRLSYSTAQHSQRIQKSQADYVATLGSEGQKVSEGLQQQLAQGTLAASAPGLLDRRPATRSLDPGHPARARQQ